MRRTRVSSLATTRRAMLRNAGRATLATGVAVALSQATPAASQESGAAGLTGTWLVTNATPGSIPNSTLVTFIPGGAFIRSGTAHLTETPGHGAWAQVGAREYDITYMTVRFDKEGTFIGHRKQWLRATIDPSGMSWTARLRGTTIDTEGVEAPLGPEGMNSAVRLVAGPFPETG